MHTCRQLTDVPCKEHAGLAHEVPIGRHHHTTRQLYLQATVHAGLISTSTPQFLAFTVASADAPISCKITELEQSNSRIRHRPNI